MHRVATYSFGQILPSADLNQLADTALGIAQLPGIWVPPPYVRCSNGADILIGGITAMMLGNANSTLQKLTESTYTPGGLAINKLYHLYAAFESSAIAFHHVISTTLGPDASLVFMTDGMTIDVEKRYICSFFTRPATAATILPFEKWGNKVSYRRSGAAAADDYLALNDGGNVALQGLSLASWVPAHARLVRMEASFLAAGGTGDKAFIITDGDSENDEVIINSYDASNRVRREFDIITNSAQSIKWKTDNAIDALKLYVVGYYG